MIIQINYILITYIFTILYIFFFYLIDCLMDYVIWFDKWGVFMNYAKYKELRRKELIKSGIYISVILLFALIATYNIYYCLKEENDKVRSSKSLDVVFHEKDGGYVTLTKVRPVSDAVGLSTHAYTFTIKNNTNTRVNYEVKIITDKEKIKEDKCGEYQMPLNIIKTGIHEKGKVSDIYNLDDLKDGVLVKSNIGPKKEINYTVRFWISQNSLTVDSLLHFHGKIEIVENGTDIASVL